jgi:hypothetical protein
VRSVGPYECLALLGKGSTGTVVLARRKGVDRMFALKLLPANTDAENLARLKREAEVASRLDHPGIVQVHDVGVHEEQPYLVMDHVPGPTLKDKAAREGPLPWRDAAALVAELARALDAAHAAGIVHRDLKPANVIMDARAQRPRVTDFGLARDLSRPSEITKEGAVIGTPYYMSPEQIRGEPADPRSDIYALGVILYELVAGKRPFEAKSVSELGWKILAGNPKPPSTHRADLPPELDQLCSRAMSVERAGRFESARALADALEALRAGGAAEAAAAAPVTAASHPKTTRVVAPAAVVAALGALVAMSLAAWVLAERREEARLDRALVEVTASAEALDARADGARPAPLARAAAEAEVARLEEAAREQLRGLAAERAGDGAGLAERARLDGHLALIVDSVIDRLAGAPGAAALRAGLLRDRGRYDEGLEECARARAAGDPDLDLLVLQFRLEAAAGRPERATPYAEELLRVAPADSPQALFARGATGHTNDLDALLALLERGLTRAPDKGYLHTFRARALRQAGEATGRADVLRAAEQAATRAIEVDPTSPDNYAERAQACLARLAQEPGAAEELALRVLADVRLARELRPEPERWVDAAMALLHLEQPQAALTEVGVALDLVAARPWSGAARAHLWSGHARAALGDEAAAVHEWREGRLGAQPPSSAAQHARWLRLVSPEARARALEGAAPELRQALERLLAGD